MRFSPRLASQAAGADLQQPPSQHTSRLEGLEQVWELGLFTETSLCSQLCKASDSQVDFGGEEPVAAHMWHAGLSQPGRHRGHMGDAHVCEASSQAHACCEKGNKKSLSAPAAFSISFLITWHIHLIQAGSFQVVSGGGRHSRNADLVCLPRQSKEKPSHNHFQTLKWLHCHYS